MRLSYSENSPAGSQSSLPAARRTGRNDEFRLVSGPFDDSPSRAAIAALRQASREDRTHPRCRFRFRIALFLGPFDSEWLNYCSQTDSGPVARVPCREIAAVFGDGPAGP